MNKITNQWWPKTADEVASVKLKLKRSEATDSSTCASKNEPSHVRRTICRNLAVRLCDDLKRHAREEESLWLAGRLTPELASLVTQFHRDVAALVDQALHRRKSGAPPTLRNARALRQKAQHFREQCLELEGQSGGGFLQATRYLDALVDDVMHYTRQIEITYAIVTIRNKKPRLHNRPTSTAKAKYGEIVLEHQAVHGVGSFPKPREATQALTDAGFPTPSRTLRDWKRQFQAETFWDFIQKRQ